eukprot:6181670-Pleurochrysis_carterae.AAC.2
MPSDRAMVLTAVAKFGYTPMIRRCLMTSCGTEARHEPNAPNIDAPHVPIAGDKEPMMLNCSPPTRTAKADVVTQPERSF